MQKRKCECEHVCHFAKERKSPNGNPGHKYGREFNAQCTVRVKTLFGTFNVCPDCVHDCMKSYSIIPDVTRDPFTVKVK